MRKNWTSIPRPVSMGLTTTPICLGCCNDLMPREKNHSTHKMWKGPTYPHPVWTNMLWIVTELSTYQLLATWHVAPGKIPRVRFGDCTVPRAFYDLKNDEPASVTKCRMYDRGRLIFSPAGSPGRRAISYGLSGRLEVLGYNRR